VPDDGARGDAARGDGAIDFDRAWQELLTSLTDGAGSTADPSVERSAPAPAGPAPAAPAMPPPAESNVADSTTAGPTTGPALDDRQDPEELTDEDQPAADNEHFEPPPAPPLPKLRGVTVSALAAMVVGILILAFHVDGGDLAWLGVFAIVGGAASLVYNMRSGPPTDSGWDDGAVL
jgi:hypothetical protein